MLRPETRSFYADAVQRVIDQMALNLDAASDLDSLARIACLSPFHFHRMFRGMVGETPLELVRRMRMERAAWRLARTDAAVTDVAFDALRLSDSQIQMDRDSSHVRRPLRHVGPRAALRAPRIRRKNDGCADQGQI